MLNNYVLGAKYAAEKLALSDDATVAALHALNLTPIALGADAITAPGHQFLLQPAGTTVAAMAARPLGNILGGSLGKAVLSPLNTILRGSGVAINGEQLGSLLGGALASGSAAYGARRLGRALTGDYWE